MKTVVLDIDDDDGKEFVVPPKKQQEQVKIIGRGTTGNRKPKGLKIILEK